MSVNFISVLTTQFECLNVTTTNTLVPATPTAIDKLGFFFFLWGGGCWVGFGRVVWWQGEGIDGYADHREQTHGACLKHTILFVRGGS